MKMGKIVKGVLTLVLGGLILAGGCVLVRKSIPKVTVPPEITGPSLSSIQFDDIPVPANFKYLSNESTVFADAGIRTSRQKYLATSFTQLDDIINFYEKHMPLHGWHKVFEKDAGWKRLLTFDKEAEQCEVLIDKTPAETVLIISINTK